MTSTLLPAVYFAIALGRVAYLCALCASKTQEKILVGAALSFFEVAVCMGNFLAS